MLSAFREATGSNIALEYIPDSDFVRSCEARHMSVYEIDVLRAMFHSYNIHGFLGNSYESAVMLGREPICFRDFLKNQFSAC